MTCYATQTDLTPQDLQLATQVSALGKKAKKSKKSKAKKQASTAAEQGPALDAEKVRQLHELIDLVYAELEPSAQTSLGPPTVSLPASATTSVSVLPRSLDREHETTPSSRGAHVDRENETMPSSRGAHGRERSASGSKPVMKDVEKGLVERCLVRYLLVKCGHKDGALKSLDDFAQTMTSNGSDARCAPLVPCSSFLLALVCICFGG